MANQRNETQQRTGNGEDFTPMPQGEQGDFMNRTKSTADNLLDHAKTTAGEAYDRVAEKTVSTIEDRKAGVTGGIRTLAQSVRRVGDDLGKTGEKTPVSEYSARYAKTAAGKLEQVADYFNNRDLRAIGRDVESFARRNPAIFLGAAFGLGLLAARFFKSSPTPSLTSQTFSADVDHQLPEGDVQGTRRSIGSQKQM